MSNGEKRKILVSPGFGAGFATWSGRPQAVAEYQPLIDFIEGGGRPSELDHSSPLIQGMERDLGMQIGELYLGGLSQVIVVEVTVPYRIDEYDGSESVITASDLWS